MKKFLSLFFVCFVLGLSAQTSFLPNIGTKWNYLYGSYASNYYYNKTNCAFEYVRDSISNGEKIKILKVDRFLMNCTTRSPKFAFVKQNNDSVWFYHKILTNETWQLLINYNTESYQTWTITVTTDAVRTYTMKVTAVSTETINGFPLKKMDVSCFANNSSYSYTTTIYERFGFINCFFPFRWEAIGCDLDYLDKFLCYQDSSFGVKEFSGLPCGYDYYVGLSENDIQTSAFDLFPVPTNERLTVRVRQPGIAWHQFKLYNSLGQLIREEDIVLNGTDVIVKTDGLEDGVYFLHLMGVGRQSSLQKFIVNR